jgi:3-dehydroquinate dehydratase/shikimate dehydrogenase
VRRDEIPKAAVMPKSTEDLHQFLLASKKLKRREKILLCMGEYDTATRILAAKIGSFLSYCSLPSSRAAPGHLDPSAMRSVYRFHKITGRTRHSFSPQIHNKGFEDLGIDAVYVPFLVDRVESFFKIARLLKIEGFSVTLPHKSAVIPFLKKRENLVDIVGACNTVLRRGRSFIGLNTDVTGYFAPLKKYFSPERMKSLQATIIGAGGAARAVVYGLTAAGCRLLILNRTLERARALASEFGCAFGPLDEQGFSRINEYRDLIVQTTNVGMDPDTEGNPLQGYRFLGTEVVYDLIYTPPQSKLLKQAQESGCEVINGEKMLLAQAHEQFKLFTGRESAINNYNLNELA